MRALVLLLLLLPQLAWGAGTGDGGGYLTSLLEDNLSGAGRVVKVTGFTGALSSQATIAELTIADDTGVWLTLKGVTLDWSRSALLSGRVEVNELSADEIDLPRLPRSGGGGGSAAPSAEASGFRLPELPVSVSIGKIAARKVVLGAPVLGQAAELSVNGGLSLAGGAGAADLAITRIDGKTGEIALKTSFANASRQLVLDLKVVEGEGGIMANLIGLPGAPALSLTMAGTGPLNDYSAAIRLATDGQERLAGTVTLAGIEGSAGATRFAADLSGDIAPLFAPDYRAFFGPDIHMSVAGTRAGSGALDLTALRIAARQITLAGRMRLGADGLPEVIDLSGRLGAADGAPVLLPLPGTPTRVRGADVSLQFDAARGDGWTGKVSLTGLDRPDLALATARLSGSGRIARATEGAGRSVSGTLRLEAEGIAPFDPALAQALGPSLTTTTDFLWQEGKPLRLSKLDLAGTGYRLTGGVAIDGIGAALALDGRATAQVDDLAHFSALAGRSLGGAATAQLSGTAQLLAGSFDLTAQIDGTGLAADVPQLDALLAGTSHIDLSARRDTAGTTLRSLHLRAASLGADAHGTLKTGEGDLSATLAFADLGALGKGYGGALTARAQYVERDGTQTVTLDGTGQDLALGQATADTLLRGKTTLALTANRTRGIVRVERFALSNPQLSATATADLGDAGRRVKLTARLADLALVAPGLPGPATVEGTVTNGDAGYLLDLTGTGPGGISAAIKGSVAADFGRADLAVSGGARAELVNASIAPRAVSGPVKFNLKLDGPPRLASLSGTVSLAGARIVAPLLGLTAEGAELSASLAGGTARITGAMTVGGGQVVLSGPIDLAPPYTADIAVTLTRVGLKDPDLFTTSVSGRMSAAGPLAGGARIAGALVLGDTELRVPSTGLGGSAAVPEGLTHRGASPAVRATLARAGLGGPAARPDRAPRRPFGLDIAIAAPARVFIRGRGLDAELGGKLALTGSTADIVPIGGFDLRRGRLEILGKRFDLTQGRLQLQGRFVPYVHLEAATTSNGVTSTVVVDGDANDPQITFTSSPELPQEEVLAQLLFGRDLTKISAFQAAQLASAVATLAGKGGEGIVSRLRKGFGLDDLDIVTDSAGNTSVKVGKYLTKRIYTDVTVGQDGTSEVNLNLDVTKSVTLRGKAGTDGNTGIGVYYERDY